ncbi:DUF3515 family protein [Nocardia sp. NPDC127579]|uniref:DUF3515 domain-containing protein n=1 Tax=Nocardia sp. NPDC127579 TaxID=3345402 RepID=UPI003639F55D
MAAQEPEHEGADTGQANARGTARLSAEPAQSGATAETTEATATPEKAVAADETETSAAPVPGRSHTYPPALVATAVALPIMLVVGVLVAAVLANRAPVEREPLTLGPVYAPAAEGPACTALLPALPSELSSERGAYTHSQLRDPQPPGTRAWQPAEGGDPIVLRCGLERPLDFHRASKIQLVNGVQWFEVRDQVAETSTWFAVDRETYVALTVPDGLGPTPLQAVSDTLKQTMPEQPIDPGPLPN